MLLIFAAGVLEEAAFLVLLRPRTGAAEKSAGLVGSSWGGNWDWVVEKRNLLARKAGKEAGLELA